MTLSNFRCCCVCFFLVHFGADCFLKPCYIRFMFGVSCVVCMDGHMWFLFSLICKNGMLRQIDPPTFIERPDNVEAEIVQNITINCIVDSNPKADIIFVFDPIDRVSNKRCIFLFTLCSMRLSVRLNPNGIACSQFINNQNALRFSLFSNHIERTTYRLIFNRELWAHRRRFI